MNPVHTSPPPSLGSILILSSPPRLRSSKRSLHLRFYDQNFVCISHGSLNFGKLRAMVGMAAGMWEYGGHWRLFHKLFKRKQELWERYYASCMGTWHSSKCNNSLSILLQFQDYGGVFPAVRLTLRNVLTSRLWCRD